MPKVDDVAAFVIERLGPLNVWKLQKLVYYSQAWHLAWDEVPLFPDRIEAWANGPVVPALYRQHQGTFRVSSWDSGNPANLSASEVETVEAVLAYYGPQTGHWLSAVTHREKPWLDARQGTAAGDNGEREITRDAMGHYYGGLL